MVIPLTGLQINDLGLIEIVLAVAKSQSPDDLLLLTDGKFLLKIKVQCLQCVIGRDVITPLTLIIKLQGATRSR